VKYAVQGLKIIYKKGYKYKKAGVIVTELTPENEKQLNFFSSENPKHKALMNTIDNLNNSIGQKKIKLACQDLDRTWKMNQEKLSPRYTTRLNEIITINS
jgi:DNA polymerase V